MRQRMQDGAQERDEAGMHDMPRNRLGAGEFHGSARSVFAPLRSVRSRGSTNRNSAYRA